MSSLGLGHKYYPLKDKDVGTRRYCVILPQAFNTFVELRFSSTDENNPFFRSFPCHSGRVPYSRIFFFVAHYTKSLKASTQNFTAFVPVVILASMEGLLCDRLRRTLDLCFVVSSPKAGIITPSAQKRALRLQEVK